MSAKEAKSPRPRRLRTNSAHPSLWTSLASFADLALGYVYLLKVDVSDGFYRIGLRPEDAPKLGLILPSGKEEEPMVDIPLTLPMG